MEPNTENTPKSEPILALTLYAMDSQVAIVEKLSEALEYIRSLTPLEFEGKHVDKNGSVIKIVNLQ